MQSILLPPAVGRERSLFVKRFMAFKEEIKNPKSMFRNKSELIDRKTITSFLETLCRKSCEG